jgi:hypothetical protein
MSPPLDRIRHCSPQSNFQLDPRVFTSMPKGNTVRGHGEFGREEIESGVRVAAGHFAAGHFVVSHDGAFHFLECGGESMGWPLGDFCDHRFHQAAGGQELGLLTMQFREQLLAAGIHKRDSPQIEASCRRPPPAAKFAFPAVAQLLDPRPCQLSFKLERQDRGVVMDRDP